MWHGVSPASTYCPTVSVTIVFGYHPQMQNNINQSTCINYSCESISRWSPMAALSKGACYLHKLAQKKRPARHQAERAVVAHYLYQSPEISDSGKPSYRLAASAERWRCRWPWRHHSWAHIRRLLRNHKLAHNRIRNSSECRWCNRMACRRRKSDHPGNGGRGKVHGGT